MSPKKHGFLIYNFSLFLVSVRPLGCVEADDVLQKCEHVLESLDQLDEQLFLEWTVGLEEICHSHLKEPLLVLDTSTGRFHVNFSPAVSTPKQQSIFKKNCGTNTSVLLSADISPEGGEVFGHVEEPEHS